MPSAPFNEIVAMLRSTRTESSAVVSIDAARASLDQTGAMFTVPAEVEVVPVEIAGVACERFRPTGLPPQSGTLLYLHGGSYTAGSLASHRALTARIAQASACEAVAVAYRLAPEHPFPAGLDDAAAVYRQLLADGTAPETLVLVGDSAGGGLTTALLLRLRDDGVALPAGAVLLSPWLDLTMSSDAVTSIAEADPMLRADALSHAAASYAGDNIHHPLISPVFADPAGLPPLLILVGTAEILLDDSRTFAERARAAGVEVDLDVEDDLIHVWPFIDGVPESAAAMDRIGSWVRRRVDGRASA
jgi:epsilon-lactone hydrolase